MVSQEVRHEVRKEIKNDPTYSNLCEIIEEICRNDVLYFLKTKNIRKYFHKEIEVDCEEMEEFLTEFNEENEHIEKDEEEI